MEELSQYYSDIIEFKLKIYEKKPRCPRKIYIDRTEPTKIQEILQKKMPPISNRIEGIIE
ncbi:hypothetical protein ACFL6L_04995 [candidate division KSB1 bacterium]